MKNRNGRELQFGTVKLRPSCHWTIKASKNALIVIICLKIDVFENLDAEEIYESMISLGSSVAYEVDRDAKNFVHGCQSQVWVEGEEQPTGWEFKLDSDSYMVKGIGNVLCRCMSGMTAEEIEQITFYDFRDLTQYFSQQRKQGMQAVINKCKQISRG